ncbi:hypothetical protein BS47DRAFT_85888 [Hydnum rufescens UP504]|uniref:Uncharacterized protein n=1 Tax=Hydnum rufescens UP504 TaxID=1448309 RepID=A0A9P6E1C7_9AGAM|nr:hypothetical protein BS47DRAFT_85888 [Hydnum rufescens UP504]
MLIRMLQTGLRTRTLSVRRVPDGPGNVVREIHHTASALKKKRTTPRFEEEEGPMKSEQDEVDLFAAVTSKPSPSKPPSPSPAPSISSYPLAAQNTEQAQTVVERHARFLVTHGSISRFCGKKPSTRYLPRHRALLELLDLVHSRAELDVFVDTIIGWRQAKRQVDLHTADCIITKCIDLGHPQVALMLIANRPKYGIDLSSLSTARALLHALVQHARPSSPTASESASVEPRSPVTSSALDDAFLAAALYPQFRLPEVSTDPISSAMLLSLSNSIDDAEARKRASALKRELEAQKDGIRSGSAKSLFATKKERAWGADGMLLLPPELRWQSRKETR